MLRRRVALAGAAAILVLLALRFAAAQAREASDTLVLSVPSNQWFEAPGEQVSISSDAKWALLTHGRTMSLYSLETREQNPDLLLNGLTSIFRAGFCGPQILVRLGQRGSEQGLFWPGAESLQLSTLPPDAVVGCSTDGQEIAYYIFGNPDRQMFVGPPRGPFKTFGVTGRITGTAFSPDNSMLYVMLFQPSGETSLVRISVHELRTKTIAHDLDADVVDAGIRQRGGEQEEPFAEADLDFDGMGVAKDTGPGQGRWRFRQRQQIRLQLFERQTDGTADRKSVV